MKYYKQYKSITNPLRIQKISKWILDVGDGKLCKSNYGYALVRTVQSNRILAQANLFSHGREYEILKLKIEVPSENWVTFSKTKERRSGQCDEYDVNSRWSEQMDYGRVCVGTIMGFSFV
ncbi:hypothetical protein Lal_00032120 [Lupinus albus]|nr:hypothetical protein Lal_00032120 [Lupinus albus]